MSTMDRLSDLQSRRNAIEQGGSKEKAEKQHQAGKLLARERIAKLLDADSFVEIDAFVQHRATDFDMPETPAPGDGVVTGYGTIDGRLVYVYSQDATVIGGALGEMHAKKICKVMDMAIKTGAPIIGISDSNGARIQEGIDALSGYGDIFYHNALASGVVPQISVVLGPCAGGAVYSPAICDFIFMVNGTSKMFMNGPQIIESTTGENVTPEEFGSAQAHASKSGVAHFVSENEEECLRQVRELIGYLPSNNLSETDYLAPTDEINRLSATLTNVIPDDPNASYDVKQVIGELVDNSVFFEIQKDFAQNIVVGFARMNGSTIGVVANQPQVMGGALDIDASDKASRFIRFCDGFNIPLVTLTDVPGYVISAEQECSGIVRHGAKLLYAYSEATVPKINVILRKAYGGAYIAMSSKHLGADMVFAWPTAEIAVMGPEGAANILFQKEIASSENPIVFRQEKIEEYREQLASPFVAAARGYVDDVIEPDSTRPRIISALEVLASKRENRPSKKHGNMPL